MERTCIENVLTKLLELGYTWIAKGDNQKVFAFKRKPVKKYSNNLMHWEDPNAKTRNHYVLIDDDSNVFKFITSEDVQPTSIQERLKLFALMGMCGD